MITPSFFALICYLTSSLDLAIIGVPVLAAVMVLAQKTGSARDSRWAHPGEPLE